MKKILIVSGILSIAVTSCLKDLFCLEGNGITETQRRNTSLFNQIENTTGIDILYKKADTVSLTVRSETNLLSHIQTEVSGGNLKIKTDPGNICFNSSERPLITITSPGIERVVLTGSGDFRAEAITGESFNIKVNGSGDASVSGLKCDDLLVTINGSGDVELPDSEVLNSDLSVSGSGDLNIKGSCDNSKMMVTGSGDIVSDKFLVRTANETISGSGNIHTNVVISLKAVISGSGNIYLKGNPLIDQTITGSGKIIKN